MVRVTRVVVGILVACVVAGCGSTSDTPAPSQPTLPSASQPTSSSQPSQSFVPGSRHDGHYRGAAAIGGADYSHHVEALLTADGEVRLHVGGPGAGDQVRSGAGVPPAAFKSAEAALFVGDVSWIGAQGRGSGVVIGERCLPVSPSPFCGAGAPAELSISHATGRITGELRVTTAQGDAIWALDVSPWSIYYRSPATRGFRGMFQERLASFAATGEPIITIDAGGQLFFQSAASGCVGNGMLAPHGDGGRYVFDVALTIESCDNTHAYLNGRFQGLATESQSGAWDYDSWLVMWLATLDGSGPRVALTTLAEGI